MLITEFSLDTPILRTALRAAPGTRISLETENVLPEQPIRVVVWAEGEDLAAFETGLADDPTIAEHAVLTETARRRLYALRLSERGEEASVYGTVIEVDGVTLDVEGTHDGWTHRVSFPDREAFATFRERCAEVDVDVDVHRIYDETDGAYRRTDDLTDPQRTTLIVAAETGYFEIPRASTLADVADRLGISQQAASERLRRGMGTLVVNTLDASVGGGTDPAE